MSADSYTAAMLLRDPLYGTTDEVMAFKVGQAGLQYLGYMGYASDNTFRFPVATLADPLTLWATRRASGRGSSDSSRTHARRHTRQAGRCSPGYRRSSDHAPPSRADRAASASPWGHEPCWVVHRPGVPNLFRCDRDQSTVWRSPSPKMIMGGSKEEKFDHPAQKPVLLSEIPLRNHTEVGEAVYDPFLGSGTALIAAETLARRGYGFEIEPRYAQIIVERWQGLTGRTAVRADA